MFQRLAVPYSVMSSVGDVDMSSRARVAFAARHVFDQLARRPAVARWPSRTLHRRRTSRGGRRAAQPRVQHVDRRRRADHATTTARPRPWHRRDAPSQPPQFGLQRVLVAWFTWSRGVHRKPVELVRVNSVTICQPSFQHWDRVIEKKSTTFASACGGVELDGGREAAERASVAAPSVLQGRSV